RWPRQGEPVYPRAWLVHELDGDLPAAGAAYADAARRATDVAERDHLVRQAARARARLGLSRQGIGSRNAMSDER
ncbi:MAG: hypothetical protein ACRD2C_28030, partial [Acidimicrobiales bacterium]